MGKIKKMIKAAALSAMMMCTPLTAGAQAYWSTDSVYITISQLCDTSATFKQVTDSIIPECGQMVTVCRGYYKDSGWDVSTAYDVIGKFDKSGNLLVFAGGDTIAKVPTSTADVSNGASLLMSYTPYPHAGMMYKSNGTVPKYTHATIGKYGYGTFTSPFATIVPSGNEWYLPSLTATGKSVMITRMRRLKAGCKLPPYTGVIVKGTKNSSQIVRFYGGLYVPGQKDYEGNTITGTELTSALEGSAVRLSVTNIKHDNPGKEVLTFGRAKATHKYGFFRYTGSWVQPCKGFLLK